MPKLQSGVNDVATAYPELVREWDTLRNSFLPTEVAKGNSKDLIWWQCSQGHSWQATPNARTSGKKVRGCPACAGLSIVAGFNDLATTHPELAAMWHPRNTTSPQEVGKSSQVPVFWLCPQGHSWEGSPRKQPAKGRCRSCPGTLAATHPELEQQWSPANHPTFKEMSHASAFKAHWECEAGHTWVAPVYSRTSKTPNNCPACANSQSTSAAEQEIAAYICAQLPDTETVIFHDRNLLQGREVDIYIPSKRIAIEYNGLYWHSEEQGKDRSYHHNKWEACKKAGVQLIQIWEDDWKNRKEQMQQLLTHKLHLTTQRIYARDTTVASQNHATASPLFEEHHIQGMGRGKYYLALEHDGRTVAGMILKTEADSAGKTLNIIRYATSEHVVGGFTKLLKHAERTLQPDKFITFSDHCVSDGGLYRNNGFIADKELKPDYMYVVQRKRVHKFNYRLKRFRNDPDLLWNEGYSERQLAQLNNIPRIWDAGKTRWTRNVHKH